MDERYLACRQWTGREIRGLQLSSANGAMMATDLLLALHRASQNSSFTGSLDLN
jgi:hypothetical protein